MIKNIIGAVVGAKLAKNTTAMGSGGGAATGAIAATAIPYIISRMSLPAMIAVGAGGYMLKKYQDRSTARRTVTPASASKPKAVPTADI